MRPCRECAEAFGELEAERDALKRTSTAEASKLARGIIARQREELTRLRDELEDARLQLAVFLETDS